MNKSKQRITQAIADVKSGKPVILIDDFDREFEGDLVIAAEKASIYNLNFAMRHARGLMCLPCFQEKLDQFEIPMMNRNNQDKYGTPFTVSIDALQGTTTGMSVYDRLKTIETFCSNSETPTAFAQPGHLFPLRAKPNLLKERRGHTEGSLELVKLSGLNPIAVIVEIMDENGNMIKGNGLEDYSKIYDLTLISIEDLYNEIYN